MTRSDCKSFLAVGRKHTFANLHGSLSLLRQEEQDLCRRSRVTGGATLPLPGSNRVNLMHSVHTMSLNYPKCISLFQCTQYTQGLPITQNVHPQCVFLFLCTQFTQGPPITHSAFSYFNALSSHKVSQSPTVCFLISMHSVHITSPNY